MNLSEQIRKSNRVYVIGNGGSYANSVHMVNDLLSVGIRAYAMDPSTLTAFSNDHGYENCFSRWIDIVGEPGDLLIALSGSGTSPNILSGVERALQKGMNVWREFGASQDLDMQASEERQIELCHEVMKELKRESGLVYRGI